MIFHGLTAVLVVLKLLNMITVSWWVVFAPSIVLVLFSILVVVIALWATSK